MDEYENGGMDPEMKQYFKRIMNSFFIGLFWMLSVVTAGLFFGLGVIKESVRWYNILFYFFAIITLMLFLFHLYRVWKKDIHTQH